MRIYRLLAMVAAASLLAGCQSGPNELVLARGDNPEIAGELPGDPDPDEEEPGKNRYRDYDRWPRPYNESPDEKYPDRVDAPTGPDTPPIFWPDTVHGDGFIRVGTFNLKGFGPNKADYRVNPRGVKITRKDRTMSHFFADYINDMKIDVIAIQEVVGARNGGLSSLEKVMEARGFKLAIGKGGDYIRLVGRKRGVLGRNTNKERCPIFYRNDVIERLGDGSERGKRNIRKIKDRDREMTYAYLGVRKDRIPAAAATDPANVHAFRFVMTCQHAPPPCTAVADRCEYWKGMPDAYRQLTKIDPDVIVAGDLNTDVRTTNVNERKRLGPLLDKPPAGLELISKDYTNLRPGGGTTIRGEHIYDDLLWQAPTEEDYADQKVIEYGFDEMFRKADGEVDKQAQNRFSDHYAVWARFHRKRDTD